MIILGIHDGHNATAAIMVDGKLMACVSEERFTRLKMETGYPINAIEYCLRQAGIRSDQIDRVAFASKDFDPLYIKIKAHATFETQDWIRQEHYLWRPLLYEAKDFSREYRRLLLEDERFATLKHYYDFSIIDKNSLINKTYSDAAYNIRTDALRRHLGIEPKKVSLYDHHRAHAAYSYYSNPQRKRDTLIFTLDGGGDGATATVFRSSVKGIQEIARTNNADLGRIYRSITLMLGMQMGHDEYKVMGLAPYANEVEFNRSWEVFKDKFKIADDMIVFGNGKPKDIFFYYQKSFEGHRFDGIAAALQKMTEDCIIEWIRAVSNKYKCFNIAFAGGVAMNVVVNGLLAQQPFIHNIYIPPSPSDESLGIGVLYLVNEEYLLANGYSTEDIQPLTDIYLGPSFDDAYLEKILTQKRISERFKILPYVSGADIADFLAKGAIIARCKGRMEFGARALGNRSILADPRRRDVIEIINRQIKYRDFWMPFAPVVLAEQLHNYFVVPTDKDLGSPYMMFVFESTDLARKDIIATLHPADKTGRPQILYRDQNPEYYDIIKAFEAKTGVGSLLNTSFNLHGDPICLTPEDAIFTFERSELDMLLLNDCLITRKL